MLNSCIITIVIHVILLALLNEPVMSSWDFAVTTKGKINFYGNDWKILTSAAHQFDELSAITFDETEEILYFNDQSHNNGTIFSLKLSPDENHRVEKILQKTKDELIQGIAFDPLERMLYWTDSKNKLIYHMSVDKKEEPTILLKLNETKTPHGIAVDVCRRKLYWTNANHRNPTIERASLDGSNYEVLIEDGLFLPVGITVDQFSKRIFWVDDRQGAHYSVESADLDGSDRRTHVENFYNVPFNLATDKEDIYWTDLQHEAIWRISKNATESEEPQKMQEFTTRPKGIVARTHFLSTQANNPECKAVVEKIKSVILAPAPAKVSEVTKTPAAVQVEAPKQFCFNEGVLNPKTNLCICPNEYKGMHCEVPVCHNYCLEGVCRISSTGYPQCTCHAGFTGDRCEKDVCTGFCLNGGRCDLENGEPVCHCVNSYLGRHCETMDTKRMCQRFCNEEDVDLPDAELLKICGNCTANSTSHGIYTSSLGQAGQNFGSDRCNESSINKTAIFVSVGVVVSLGLVYVIIKALRHVYKPIRPRIKKTYVVHKNVMPTPLTCRPTTEQCEITIENCCNMNICDTPCFDPKTLQQEVTRKEDKKTLLNNMDADLMY